ncbi:hypothetical protein VNO80_01246 [Phaseolus coccineus]|uniref:Uncharacterized protein n=1 Tax=Phaseolus coccineus TaxID=3886 RepID=A0AAN9NZP4_PHACN
MDETRRKSEGREDDDGFSLSQTIVQEFRMHLMDNNESQNMNLYHVIFVRVQETRYIIACIDQPSNVSWVPQHGPKPRGMDPTGGIEQRRVISHQPTEKGD